MIDGTLDIWTNSPKYIELLLFSVQFCGMSPIESPFLKFFYTRDKEPRKKQFRRSLTEQ
jgi:hypothetical protein